jgi:hypothetical protein
LREVVGRSLEQFEKHPGTSPLPVLLASKEDSIEKRVEAILSAVVLKPEMLAAHLQAGDFFVVLDGVTESGPSEEKLWAFVHGPAGRSTPLLLSGRPNRASRNVVEGTARWMVVEPRRLDEVSLGAFVAHYGGKELSGPLKAICRGTGSDTYLPILVRMAMTSPGGEDVKSVADVYRDYFLRLFEAQFPQEVERFKFLGTVSQWCLQTYWKDGGRKRAYEATELQERLRQAGLLVPADDRTPPREVKFFHDSMQSYLTANGLALEDKAGYGDLPRGPDDPATVAWNRSRVLRRAAGHPRFLESPSDILLSGGSELFQLCLVTFEDQDVLRRWLRDELLRWADDPDQGLKRRQVVAALPTKLRPRLERMRGARRILRQAAEQSFVEDQQAGSLTLLGTLYAGIAPLIEEPEENEGVASQPLPPDVESHPAATHP